MNCFAGRLSLPVSALFLALMPAPAVATVIGSGQSTSIASSFNSIAIPTTNFIWFSSVFSVKGLGADPVTVSFTNQTIQFTADGTPYNVPVPDATVTFSPTATSATTTYDTTNNQWLTTTPSNLAGNTFLSGLMWTIPDAGFPGGVHPVTWQGTISSPTCNLTITWKWAAEAYCIFNDYASLGVKPVDDRNASQYKNADHAGTPELWKKAILPGGGARGKGAPNYIGNYTTTATVVLPPCSAPLTIIADNKSLTYGGTAPPFTATYNGFVNGDTPASLAGTLAFALSPNPAPPLPVGSYTITPGGQSSSTYTITYVNGTLRVNPAALTVTPANATRVYGSANPALTGAITGIQNGDNITATYSTTATAGSPVGTYPITATLSDPDHKLGNYTVTVNTGTLTVTPAPLTVTANNASRVYGAPNPAFTAAYTGFVNGDTSSALGGALSFQTAATPSSAVGSYPVTPGGLTSSNYAITFVPGTLTVTPAALTVTADNKSMIYGAPAPTLTASYSGFVNGDTAASLSGTLALALSPNPAPPQPVGSYTITPSGLSSSNYTITYVNGTLTVTPAPTVTTVNKVNAALGQAVVMLTAQVTAQAPSTATVNEGAVTFVVRTPTQQIIGAPMTASVNANGKATVFYNLPGASASINTITASYTDGSTPANFLASVGTATLTIPTVQPAFSGLASWSIQCATPTLTLSGTLRNSGLIPTGSVSITLNSVTQTAAIDPTTGNFTSTFNTSALTEAGSPYTVTYSYPGDANFRPVTDASTQVVVSCVSGGGGGNPQACTSAAAMGLLIQGSNVSCYVPNGSFPSDVTNPHPATGIQLVPLEGTGVSRATIPTANPVNSCAANWTTGEVVATANNTDVYLINGSTITTTLTSGAFGVNLMSGGPCTNCGVALDTGSNKAVLAVAQGGNPDGTNNLGGIQLLDLNTNTFAPPIALNNLPSEELAVDSQRHLVLSPTEGVLGPIDFQILQTQPSAALFDFVNAASFDLTTNFDAGCEDCSTGITLASNEFNNSVYITDLSQAVFTPGAPAGTWNAPGQFEGFTDLDITNGWNTGPCGIAIAQGAHLGVVTDEFGGGRFGIIQLPSTSGSGMPAIVDLAVGSIPSAPDGSAWHMGEDPHTVVAYISPNTGKAMGVIVNLARTYVALVDLQALLASPRKPGTHTVDPSYDLVGNHVVTFISTH